MATFWDRLYDLLTKNKMSARELALTLGISTANTTFWKQGSIPSADIACKIAKELDTTVEYLIEGEQADIPPDVIQMAYEIMSLPPLFQRLIRDNLESYKSEVSYLSQLNQTD